MRRPQFQWLLIAVLTLAAGARADSTINPVNSSAWSANAGWINCRGDITHGAVIGESVCSGYLYSANAGWINLGNGTPANGIRYQNNSATDFGVNLDGVGNLRGLAWGANIGWLVFTNRDSAGAVFEGPKVDLLTGRLSGFVFSANAGWISLSNAMAFVQADRIVPGTDSDGDGIADSFEYQWVGNLTTMTATSNQDGDGSSDLEEYLAGTNPVDSNDNLRVTSFAISSAGTNAAVTWTTSPARFYHLQQRLDLSEDSAWLDSGLGLITPDDGLTTTRHFSSPATAGGFLRVEAVRPLSP
jgi:hypothetical protein